ncbi:MAG: hypothetical protein R6X02_02115 [Enhygromyxa sp.]
MSCSSSLRHRWKPLRAALWGLSGSMLLLTACIEDEESILPVDPPPSSRPAPPEASPEELHCDIPSLFEDRCGGSICHSAGLSTAASLDLTSPGVEDRVVGQPGQSCAGVLAEPADPEGSLLYLKVLDKPSCGARMPLNGDALSETEKTCLRDWISGLLPSTGDDGFDDTCPGCACEPDAVELCYSGPPGTADIGMCKSGTRTCGPDGAGWSGCEGEVLPLGENCFTADIDEDCDGATPECTEVWSRSFGDERTQVMRSVAVDSKGNIYSAGDFEGVVSFGGEALVASGDKSDIVIAKHDRYGNPLWSQRFGDSSNQFAAKIVVDSKDNIVFVGRVYGHTDFGGGPLQAAGSGDVIVAKFDSDGNHLWSQVFGGKDPERAERVAIASNDDVIVTGTFTSSVDFGGGLHVSKGLRDAFVLRLDGATGAHVFSRPIGGSGDDYGFGVAVDGSKIVIAGRFQKSINLGGTLTSAGGTDLYVARLSGGGSVEWKKRFGGSGDESVHDLAISPVTKEIVVLGEMEGTVNFGAGKLVSAGARDIFILGLSPNGTPTHSANYGDKSDQFGISNNVNTWMTLTTDDQGIVYFGGMLIGKLDLGPFALVPVAGSTDIFYVALGPDGAPLWGHSFGSADADLALDLAVSANKHMVMAGRSFGDAIDFGPAGVIETRGESDGLVVKVPL